MVAMKYTLLRWNGQDEMMSQHIDDSVELSVDDYLTLKFTHLPPHIFIHQIS
jgi:hypothetical protein